MSERCAACAAGLSDKPPFTLIARPTAFPESKRAWPLPDVVTHYCSVTCLLDPDVDRNPIEGKER